MQETQRNKKFLQTKKNQIKCKSQINSIYQHQSSQKQEQKSKIIYQYQINSMEHLLQSTIKNSNNFIQNTNGQIDSKTYVQLQQNHKIKNKNSENMRKFTERPELIDLRVGIYDNQKKKVQIIKSPIEIQNKYRQQQEQQLLLKIEQIMHSINKQYNNAIRNIQKNKNKNDSHHKLLLQIDSQQQCQQQCKQYKNIQIANIQQMNANIQIQNTLQIQQYNNNNSMYSIIDIEWQNENQDINRQYGKYQQSQQYCEYVKQYQQYNKQQSEHQQNDYDEYQQIQYNEQNAHNSQTIKKIVSFKEISNNDVLHLRNKLQLKEQEICYLQITHNNNISQFKTQLTNKNQRICALQIQLQQLNISHQKQIRELILVNQNKQAQLNQYLKQLQAQNGIYRNKWAQNERMISEMKDKCFKLEFDLQNKQAEYQRIYENYDQLLTKLNAYVKLIKKQTQPKNKIDDKKGKQHNQMQCNNETNSKTCDQLYSELQQQYVHKMSQHLHSQSKNIKHKQMYIAQIKHQNAILNMQINKCEQKVQGKQKQIKALNQIISHYKASRKTVLDIYVQEQIEYLRSEVVNLNKKLQNKEKQLRSKLMKKSKHQWKQTMNINSKQYKNKFNLFKEESKNQLSIMSGQCSQYDQKKLIRKIAEYEEFIILNTFRNQGIWGHCCRLAKQYNKNNQQFAKIENDIAKYLKKKQKKQQFYEYCQEELSNNEQHKQNKCKKCYNILSSSLKLCEKFNASIVCNQNKEYSHIKKQQNRKRKLIRVASQTYDDSIIYERCNDSNYYQTTMESKQI